MSAPRSTGGRPGAAVAPARRVALEVLTAVRTRDAYANLLLPSLLARAHLPGPDAAYATELAYATLRRLGHYDAVIALASGRRIEDVDPPLLDVLRLGAHQLLATRTAPHAAVNESVAQARTAAGPRASGFANAVLRKVGAADDATWTERLLEPVTDPLERLGVAESHPRWVVAELDLALAATVGPEDLVELLAADNVAPAVGVVALPGLAERTDQRLAPHPLSPVGMVLEGGDPARVPGVREGVVRVQDAGSQLAALALSRARPAGAGERWLDLCAGPGGKAALLAAEAALGGATLVANEIAPGRARLVERALAGVPGPVEVRVGDGRHYASGAERFDRVLLDAPCSGLGALRRRPEARWRKSLDDLPPLAVLQGQLLDAAVAALEPGGLLAYVTCSPVVAETDAVVAAALERHPGLRPVDTVPVLEAVVGRRVDGARRGTGAQLWPHRHDTDAMYIQLLTH